MGWFKSDKDVVGLLAAEVSDLREQLRAERRQASEREDQLLDRILALSAPAALREVRRSTAPSSSDEPLDGTPRRLHFPGYQPSTRPPFPAPRTPEEETGEPKAG